MGTRLPACSPAANEIKRANGEGACSRSSTDRDMLHLIVHLLYMYMTLYNVMHMYSRTSTCN